MQDNFEDIPIAYLLLALLGIVAILAAAAIVVIELLRYL
jgi:hypothetical protein